MSKTTTLIHQQQLTSAKKKRKSSVGELANNQEPGGEKYNSRSGNRRDKVPEEKRRIQNQDGYRLGGNSQLKSRESPLNTMKRRSSNRRGNDKDNGKPNAKGKGDEDYDHNSSSNSKHPDPALRPLADQKVGKGNSKGNPNGEKDAKAQKARTEGGFIAAAESTDLQAPKQPLLEYYKSRGVDYNLLRKDCEIAIQTNSKRGRAGAGLAVDSFKIPQGYTVEDLPSNESFESRREEPALSPAVLMAKNNNKFKIKAQSDPNFTVEGFITNIGMKMRLYQNGKENKPEPMASSSSKPTADNMEENCILPPPVTDNNPFPDGSLNDSDLFLITVSQQAEYEFKESKGQTSNKDQTPPDHGPTTSTPVCDEVRNESCENETPKARSSGFSRMRNRKTNKPSEMETSDDNFDKSTLLFEESITEETKEEDSPIPRKSLKFDASPINSVEQKQPVTSPMQDVVGDFEEDGNDHIFSQLEYATPAENKINEASDHSDENFETPMQEGGEVDFDSFNIDMADMEALDVLEAEHCGNIANIIA